MKYIFDKKTIDKIFEIGILAKSIFGFFDVLAGITLAVSGKLIVDNFIISFAQQEIADDPNDFIANYLINAANNFYGTTHVFAVIYLLFHGIINMFLAVALLKNKLWAYPWAITGFSLFAVYQVYRYLHTHSVSLLILTIFDILVILIVILEHRRHYKRVKELA